MSWNINGWNERNCIGRLKVIQGLSNDIVALNETHMSGEREITVEGYKSYMHNRVQRNCFVI